MNEGDVDDGLAELVAWADIPPVGIPNAAAVATRARELDALMWRKRDGNVPLPARSAAGARHPRLRTHGHKS